MSSSAYNTGNDCRPAAGAPTDNTAHLTMGVPAGAFASEEQRIMAAKSWLSLAVALGLVWSSARAADPPAPPPKLPATVVKAKLDAARATYQTLWSAPSFRYLEPLYQWSCRWLEAQRLLSDKKEDQIAALEAHAERMDKLEQFAKHLYKDRLTTVDQVTATAYYRAEAEGWCVQARQAERR